MRRSRFSEEQIIGILREQEACQRTAEVCCPWLFPETFRRRALNFCLSRRGADRKIHVAKSVTAVFGALQRSS
jgi:hypothetical protein